ncbi:heavy-metal-associated domain-containing protein [Pseudalkalibacillus sp. A8]|uniref:heavy-metal-associated domain-containing protein n=1 Tax=Pseudalkalibacillus sp. A8 TaxID=3382641 RepID=UPI0038B550C9
MKTKSIAFKQMNTKTDADTISKVLHDVWGVRQVEVNLDTQEATVSYNENAASFEDFQQAVVDAGFEIENPIDIVKKE